MPVTLSLPDLDALDPAALKAMILAQQDHYEARHESLSATLSSRATEIERLKMLVDKPAADALRSEERERSSARSNSWSCSSKSSTRPRPSKRSERPLRRNGQSPPSPFAAPLPEHLPREVHTHPPDHTACPDCGGRLRELGQDVAEMLEYVRACFKVIRHVRPKLSCDGCDRIVQAPAPSRPIDRGLAGPGLLAHVLVAKYADSLPLYRQSEIYSREGVDLDRSTLAGWVGATADLLLRRSLKPFART